MRVQGTEQIIMGKVTENTNRRDVKDTKRSDIDMNLRAKRDESGEEQPQVTRENMSAGEAIERINRTMDALNIRLKFEMHSDSGEYYVKVINEASDEVIRQIPAEKTLDLLAHVKRMVGVLVDQRV